MSTMNQPAHPMHCDDHSDASNYISAGMSGLTKLEYAAVHIMAGLSANPRGYDGTTGIVVDSDNAVERARALFAALEESA